MAADKYAQLDWFQEIAEKTDVLLLDRYLLSQRVYAAANDVEAQFAYNLLEYLPPADFQFYMDISPEESMKRKGQHGDNDKYERNAELLSKAREQYLWFIGFEEQDGVAMTLDSTLEANVLHEKILQRALAFLEQNEGARL